MVSPDQAWRKERKRKNDKRNNKHRATKGLHHRLLSETHKGLKRVTRFNAREFSLLPYLETVVTDIHF